MSYFVDRLKSRLAVTVSVAGILAAVSIPVMADDVAPTLSSWADSIKFSGHIDGGITTNPSVDAGKQNFGALFQDKANQVLLNQLMGTIQRPVDSTSSSYDVGFTLTGMYGSDARYTHSFSEFDHLIHDRNQIDVVQATIDLHAPVLPQLLDSGIDLKIGEFPSPMGAEVIDSTANYLYSHSYIFNFGVPYKNTGFLATAHVNPMLDLYAGLDTGVNAFVGAHGYNNDFVKGQFGFGLNLMDGNLTILGFSHIGEENPSNLTGLQPGGLRYLNDITTTWKATPDLTLTTDVNYIQDDGLGAIGYGVAQYAVYTLNDHVTLVGRAEVWRDNSGAFVAAFPGDFDFVNAERGLPSTSITASRTTYGAVTVGVNYKPEVPKAIEGLVIRPEFRIDDALSGNKPFNSGRDDVSVTPAIDIVIPF